MNQQGQARRLCEARGFNFRRDRIAEHVPYYSVYKQPTNVAADKNLHIIRLTQHGILQHVPRESSNSRLVNIL